MAAASGWLDDEGIVKDRLREAHRARHNAGREETRLRKAEIERLRAAGEHARADALDEREWKKGIGHARRKRLREEREAAIDGRRLKAAIAREERILFKTPCPPSLFKQFEPDSFGLGRRAAEARDLYYEFISRGLQSGRKRYERHQKRLSARTTRWKSGEMGRKVRYIVRDDALEEVEGNILTNMGEDIAEVIACSRLLEELEHMSRSNGGVYKHVIIGVPHDLSPRGRAELLAELTEPLRRMELPFCAALHKPDAKGDQRNNHVHILVSLRPMKRLGDHQWEFAPAKRTWLDTTAGIKLQRRYVAAAFNRALAAAGQDVRWTHQSRATRGLPSPGNNKKGPEKSRAESDERDADAAVASAQVDLTELDDLAAGLDALDHVSIGLEQVAGRFDDLGACVIDDLESLRAQAADQVTGLAALCERHEALRPLVEELEATRASAVEEKSDMAAIAEVTVTKDRDPQEWAREPDRSEITSPVDQSNERPQAIDQPEPIDAFAEANRFLHRSESVAVINPDQKSKPKAAKVSRSSTELELADAAARLELRDHWDPITDEAAFERVRTALLRSPPALHAEPLGDGDYRLFVGHPGINKDIASICRSEAGRVYLRLVLDDVAPPPAADRASLKSFDLLRTGGARALAEAAAKAAAATAAQTAQSIGQPQSQGPAQGYSVHDLAAWQDRTGRGR